MQHVESTPNRLRLPTFSAASVSLRNSILRKCSHAIRCSNLKHGIFADLEELLQPLPRVDIEHSVIIKSCDRIELITTLHPDETAVIGRSNRAGIFLSDPRISSAHCCLLSDGIGNFNVMDLGSLNGTWVSAQRLSAFQSYRLTQDKTIKVGPYSIKIIKKSQRKGCACHGGDSVQLNFVDFKTVPNSEYVLIMLMRRADAELPIYLSRQLLSRYLTFYYGLNTNSNETIDFPDFVLSEMIRAFCRAFSERMKSRGYGEFIVSLGGFKNAIQSDRPQVRMRFDLKYDEREFLLDVAMDAEGFNTFIEESNTGNSGLLRLARFEELSNLKIPLKCSLKTIRIPIFQWEKLKSGDLVMLGIRASGKGNNSCSQENAFLRIGHNFVEAPGFIGEIVIGDHEIGIQIKSYYRNGGTKMNQDEFSEEISELATSICETCLVDLEDASIVSLRVELGEATLSLSEILNLQIGMIIGLKHHISDLFDLKVGNQIWARGRLVCIDDEFGMELIEKVEL